MNSIHSGEPPWAPGPELTILHAEALRQSALGRLSDGPAMPALDLSATQAIDSAGIQLLLALRRSLVERGQPWCVSACSAAVRDALATYGLQDLLEPACGVAR